MSQEGGRKTAAPLILGLGGQPAVLGVPHPKVAATVVLASSCRHNSSESHAAIRLKPPAVAAAAAAHHSKCLLS